jgi:hypothetical protein
MSSIPFMSDESPEVKQAFARVMARIQANVVKEVAKEVTPVTSTWSDITLADPGFWNEERKVQARQDGKVIYFRGRIGRKVADPTEGRVLFSLGDSFRPSTNLDLAQMGPGHLVVSASTGEVSIAGELGTVILDQVVIPL